MTTHTDLNPREIIKQAMYSSKIARLLAEENLAIEFSDRATTASFEPITRTLTFPYNTAMMDKDVHEALMFHEISHAINLPRDSIDRAHKSKVDFGCFNIVVDIRDERLIKEKYPASVPIFNRAYEKLFNQGFFSSPEELHVRSFADRLNVYAKCGVKALTYFDLSESEMSFYYRCMKAETFEDVIALSEELSQLNGIDRDAVVKYAKLAIGELGATGDEMSDDERRQLIEELMRKIIEDTTQDVFDSNFAKSCVNNAVLYSYPKPARVFKNQWVFCKEFLQGIADCGIIDPESTLMTTVRSHRKEIQTSVDAMIRVFETKKAAQKYRNIKISDTGLIDTNKLFQYKVDDRIFRKSAKLPNSKNHGYFIMLDFSGSMSKSYSSVIDQVVIMTEFFRKIQVPYKVVAFGCSFDDNRPNDVFDDSSAYGFLSTYCGRSVPVMVEVLSHDMTVNQHNMAIVGLRRKYGIRLGGTPTASSMIASEQFASEFFKQTGVDKKHFIVITDGEPTDVQYTCDGKSILAVDVITKSVTTIIGNAAYSIPMMLGRIFEQRHGLKFTTMYITSSLDAHKTEAFTSTPVSDSGKKQFNKQGYTTVRDATTDCEFIFAKPVAAETDVTEFAIDEEMSVKQMARQITNNMKTIRKSRSFLTALAEMLSE